LGDSGQRHHRNKWQRYAKGTHTPHSALASQVDKDFPGSAIELNHMLWSVLRSPSDSAGNVDVLLKGLGPDIQRIVFEFNESGVGASYKRRRLDRRLLWRLECRANIDALACLTLLLLEAAELREQLWVFEIARRIYSVLLILGVELSERGVANELFQLYTERIFPLSSWENRRFCFDGFNYSFMSSLLNIQAFRTKNTFGRTLNWRERARVMLKLLNGDMGQDVLFAFLPPFVFDGPIDDAARDRIELDDRLKRWGLGCLLAGKIEPFPPSEIWRNPRRDA